MRWLGSLAGLPNTLLLGFLGFLAAVFLGRRSSGKAQETREAQAYKTTREALDAVPSTTDESLTAVRERLRHFAGK